MAEVRLQLVQRSTWIYLGDVVRHAAELGCSQGDSLVSSRHKECPVCGAEEGDYCEQHDSDAPVQVHVERFRGSPW